MQLTWHDGDRLERPEHPERPQSGQVSHLDEGGEVAGEDDDEVQPVPGVAQVGVVLEDEASGHGLDRHLQGVDGQEDVSGGGEMMEKVLEEFLEELRYMSNQDCGNFEEVKGFQSFKMKKTL